MCVLLLACCSVDAAPAAATASRTHARPRSSPPSSASLEWDLTGAALRSIAVDEDACAVTDRQGCSQFIVRWLPPHIAQSTSLAVAAATPPLLYTVFVELPTAGRTKSLCRVTSDATNPTHECRFDAQAEKLPRDQPLSLQLLAECDPARMPQHEHGRATPPRCPSSLSSRMTVTLDTLAAANTPTHAATTMSLRSGATPLAPRVMSPSPTADEQTVSDDDDVRDMLYQLYGLTNGPLWVNATNWCDDSVPLCDWFGITCDPARSTANSSAIVSFDLNGNGLNCPNIIDINELLNAMPELGYLDLSMNMIALMPLDLRNLTELTVLHLGFQPGWDGQSITLPPKSHLVELDLSASFWTFNVSAVPRLQQLVLSGYQAPLQFQWIWHWPKLLSFVADDSTLSSDQVAENGSGLISGVLTQYILSNLYLTNPVLQQLNIASTLLSFDWLEAPGEDNWPFIVSLSLQGLDLSNLPQLRTATSGPKVSKWLAGLPSLVSLSLTSLPGVHLNTAAFAQAITTANTLQTVTAISTAISGDLMDLCGFHQLLNLQLDQTGLQSTLPVDVSACWPKLESFSACCNDLAGSLSSFAGLPNLFSLRVQENDLTGPFPADFVKDSQFLVEIDVSVNYLTGPVPSFTANTYLYSLSFDFNNLNGGLPSFPHLPLLFTLSGGSNVLEGELPADIWDNLVNLAVVDLSNNDLQGKIPDCSTLRQFNMFQLSNNNFNGQLPTNVSAKIYDVSFNNLSGPLIFPGASASVPLQVLSLNVAGQSGGQMRCPIHLGHLNLLVSLDMHSAGFSGCDFSNSTEVRLPDGLQTLDISFNAWKPLLLSIPPSVQVLKAQAANVVALDRPSSSKLSLQKLHLADAAFGFVSSLGDLQLVQWTSLLDVSPQLSVLQCTNCSLRMDLQAFLPLLSQSGPRPLFQELNLAQNFLSGTIPSSMLSINKNGFSLPRSTTTLNLSSNPTLGGQLPMASVYPNLLRVDLSNTTITGSLPSSFGLLESLQQLALQNTSLSCPMTLTASGNLHCELPAWLSVSQRAIEASPLDPNRDYHCPMLNMASANFSLVTLDEDYHRSTLCTCNTNSFGRDGHCVRCPSECDCSGDIVAGCYPIIQSGLVVSDAFGNVVEQASIRPFVITAMLPCPRTTTGASLCNPNGVAWKHFYDVQVTDASEPADDVELRGLRQQWLGGASVASDWCYSGHTGRLCAQCSAGWFASGRWCLTCQSVPVHALLLVGNLAIGLLLVVFLYRKSPGTGVAAAELTEYVARMQAAKMRSPFGSAASASLSNSSGGAGVFTNNFASEVDSGSGTWGSPISTAPSTEASAANPAKLLVFFTQQLSVLLRTSTSLPEMLAGLLTAVSAAGSGFSLSSLLALECLHTGWSLSAQCVGALAGPLLLGVVCLLIKFYKHKYTPPKLDAAVSVSDFNVLVERAAVQSRASRAYGVVLSTAYLLAFPSAYTCISALTCTDLREWHVGSAAATASSAAGFSPSSRTPVFLNLYPAVECDSNWATSVLPHALVGVLFWFVVFPVGSTMFFRRMRAAAMAAPERERGGGEAAKAVAAWPVCSDLLQPFKPRWWYWEQVLLARRLTLCLLVAVIPSDSVFLPLCLLLLFEFSALLQHYAQPYRHAALNAAELASLYLLLLNYLSSVVFQTAFSVGSGGFGQSEDVWAALLFAANLIFLLGLLGALSSRVRRAYARVRDAIKRRMAARGWISLPEQPHSHPGGGSGSVSPAIGGRGDSFSPVNLSAAASPVLSPSQLHSPKPARPPYYPPHGNYRTAPEGMLGGGGGSGASRNARGAGRMVRDPSGVLQYYENGGASLSSTGLQPLLAHAGPSFSSGAYGPASAGMGSHVSSGRMTLPTTSGRTSPASALFQPQAAASAAGGAVLAAGANPVGSQDAEQEYYLQDQ